MTLTDPERRTKALILRSFSPNSIALEADYVTVVENSPIMSVKYYLAVPVLYFWPKLTNPAAPFLCDSWATGTRTGSELLSLSVTSLLKTSMMMISNCHCDNCENKHRSDDRLICLIGCGHGFLIMHVCELRSTTEVYKSDWFQSPPQLLSH